MYVYRNNEIVASVVCLSSLGYHIYYWQPAQIKFLLYVIVILPLLFTIQLLCLLINSICSLQAHW